VSSSPLQVGVDPPIPVNRRAHTRAVARAFWGLDRGRSAKATGNFNAKDPDTEHQKGA